MEKSEKVVFGVTDESETGKTEPRTGREILLDKMAVLYDRLPPFVRDYVENIAPVLGVMLVIIGILALMGVSYLPFIYLVSLLDLPRNVHIPVCIVVGSIGSFLITTFVVYTIMRFLGYRE